MLRIFAISISSIAAVGLVICMMRVAGLTTGYAPLHHPFSDLEHPIVALGGDGDPQDSLEAYDRALALGSQVVLGIHANRSLDGVWIASTNDRLQVENYDGKTLKISDVVQRYTEPVLYIEVRVRFPQVMHELVKVLDPKDKEERFVIHSAYATASREIRKIRPLWLYGSDPSTIVRFLTMSSIYLETITDLKADLVVSPIELRGRPVFTPRVIQEIERRQKLIMVEEPENFPPQAFGVVTTKVRKLLNSK